MRLRPGWHGPRGIGPLLGRSGPIWRRWQHRAQRARRGLRLWLDRQLARVRRNEHAFMVTMAVLLGVAGAGGAIAFREIIPLAQTLFYGTGSRDGIALSPWWMRLLMPAVGGLIVGQLVVRVGRELRGSGIPEVMEAVSLRGGVLRARVVWGAVFGAGVSIGSGGSLGREGPIVHTGAALGSLAGQLLQVSARRVRTFVACGAAAGIAGTFNAPIAGALFAGEVILGQLGMASLAPVLIASVVSTVVVRTAVGDAVAFSIPHYELVSAWEMPLYAGLGLLAGLTGVLFVRTLYGVCDAFDRSRLPESLRPALGGLAVGMLGVGLPQVLGVGYATIDHALRAEVGLALLVALLLGKLLATALSVGSGGSGGVFSPSLFLGALLGAAWGTAAHRLLPEMTALPGAYALVGMGALVAGTTHAPITAILMIFELTNDFHIIPPLMLACTMAVIVSRVADKESIYTAKLVRRGVHLAEGRDVNVLRAIRVADVMVRDAPTIGAAESFSALASRLLAGEANEILVVDGAGCLVGVVGLRDVGGLLAEADEVKGLAIAADVADTTVPCILPGDNLDLCMHLFGRTHRDELPVCASASDRRLLGMVTHNAVIDAYNRRIFHLDLPGGFGSLIGAVDEGRTVEVLGGLHLAEVDVPHALVGKTLAEARFRGDHELEVVLIRTPGHEDEQLEGRRGHLPSADAVLSAGEKLLVMGTLKAIDRLRH